MGSLMIPIALATLLSACLAQTPSERRTARCQRYAAGPVAQAECHARHGWRNR